MEPTTFGYRCQECGEGTVQRTMVPNFSTKVRGYPLKIESAEVGICDRCGAKHFSAGETKRWERLFEEKMQRLVLTPGDIQNLRKDLSLSMGQFAFLIGSTRQSLHNWERSNRITPQSRMADLMMKLVRVSAREGPVDVIRFLIEEARGMGISLELGDPADSPEPIQLLARRTPRRDTSLNLVQLVAETESENEIIALVTDDDKPQGMLSYDFLSASLDLEFLTEVVFDQADVELHFNDGQVTRVESVPVRNGLMHLLSKTPRREGDVKSVRLFPITARGRARE